MTKTFKEINEKIRRGEAVVVDAEEIIGIVESDGLDKAAKEVDVVTTGTFGAMCSSGVFLNTGHSDPPIKITKAYLNNINAYAGLAAVDLYLGATELDENCNMKYGGAHVIQDLVDGKDVELTATAYGTDCYPRKEIRANVNLASLNQAVLCNPRNSYQNYAVATNCSERTIYTYMGTLLPRNRNATYSSAGQLSPLLNDPYYLTTGIGTRIFLGGAHGYVYWHGTQHNPAAERKPNGTPVGPAGTLAVVGDLKEMSSKYLRAASLHRYGTSLYVGIGVPIPILNKDILSYASVRDEDIYARIIDYSVPRRTKPALGEVNYKQLRSGKIEINGKTVATGGMSSYSKAKCIAQELKRQIENNEFLLQKPISRLPNDTLQNPLDIRDSEVKK
ncbi:MAG: homocysteine biosynthesis protein [archaeon]